MTYIRFTITRVLQRQINKLEFNIRQIQYGLNIMDKMDAGDVPRAVYDGWPMKFECYDSFTERPNGQSKQHYEYHL
jgi:hypothetical protein